MGKLKHHLYVLAPKEEDQREKVSGLLLDFSIILSTEVVWDSGLVLAVVSSSLEERGLVFAIAFTVCLWNQVQIFSLTLE